MPKTRKRPAPKRRPSSMDTINRASDYSGGDRTSAVQSRQVDWLTVHEWVRPRLDAAGKYPWPGTPAWVELADDDRRKWAGLLDFAQHHALRVEVAQRSEERRVGKGGTPQRWWRTEA